MHSAPKILTKRAIDYLKGQIQLSFRMEEKKKISSIFFSLISRVFSPGLFFGVLKLIPFNSLFRVQYTISKKIDIYTPFR